jgi:hypothetical protein
VTSLLDRLKMEQQFRRPWRREADFSNSFAAAPSALPVGFVLSARITGKKIRGLINQASGSTY